LVLFLSREKEPMTLHQLSIWTVVAKHQSVTKAADNWTDPLGLDSLREQVRMPGGKEKGSHHGREKMIYANFQAAGSGGAVE